MAVGRGDVGLGEVGLGEGGLGVAELAFVVSFAPGDDFSPAGSRPQLVARLTVPIRQSARQAFVSIPRT